VRQRRHQRPKTRPNKIRVGIMASSYDLSSIRFAHLGRAPAREDVGPSSCHLVSV
jgi:hypothetical protein